MVGKNAEAGSRRSRRHTTATDAIAVQKRGRTKQDDTSSLSSISSVNQCRRSTRTRTYNRRSSTTNAAAPAAATNKQPSSSSNNSSANNNSVRKLKMTKRKSSALEEKPNEVIATRMMTRQSGGSNRNKKHKKNSDDDDDNSTIVAKHRRCSTRQRSSFLSSSLSSVAVSKPNARTITTRRSAIYTTTTITTVNTTKQSARQRKSVITPSPVGLATTGTGTALVFDFISPEQITKTLSIRRRHRKNTKTKTDNDDDDDDDAEKHSRLPAGVVNLYHGNDSDDDDDKDDEDDFSIKHHIPASVLSSSSSVVATLTPTIDYIRTYGEDYWNELHELDRPIIMTEHEDAKATPSKTSQNNKNKTSSSASSSSSSSTSRTKDHPFASSPRKQRRRRNSSSITRKSSHRRRSSRSSTSTSTSTSISNNKYNGGRIPFGSPSQLKYSSSSASASSSSALSMSSSSISHVTPTHRNINSNNSSFTRPTFTEAYWKKKSTNAKKKKKKKQQHDDCEDYPPTDSEPGPPCESTQPMLVQPQLTPKMRSILLDWLIELSEHFTFASSTLHVAISLVDRVLASGKDLDPGPGGSCGGGNVRDMGAAVVATPAATSRLRPRRRSSSSSTSAVSNKSLLGAQVEVKADTANDNCDVDDGDDDDDDDDDNDDEESFNSNDTRCYRIPRDRFQLLGATCVWLACKLEEIKPPKAREIAYVSDHIYSIEQIKTMEKRICNALDFRFYHVPTPHQFLLEFMRANFAGVVAPAVVGEQQQQQQQEGSSGTVDAAAIGVGASIDSTFSDMAQYLLELGRLPFGPTGRNPSLLAAAAIYLARVTLGTPRSMRGKGTPATAGTTNHNDSTDDNNNNSNDDVVDVDAVMYWTPTLEYYTGYTKHDLYETVVEIHAYHRSAESSDLKAIFNKYKAKKYHRVALKTVVLKEDLGF